jgi:hypothetical protein
MIFVFLAVVTLLVSFVIALISLIREQKAQSSRNEIELAAQATGEPALEPVTAETEETLPGQDFQKPVVAIVEEEKPEPFPWESEALTVSAAIEDQRLPVSEPLAQVAERARKRQELSGKFSLSDLAKKQS